MRLAYLFFSLLLCLTSYAQPNPINRRAMAIAGLAKGPIDIPNFPVVNTNLWLRFRASDLPVGPKVSSWIDEIQAVQFNQGDSTKQPTNSAIGVYFDGSATYLTNGGQVFPNAGANYALLFIFKLNTAGTAFGGLVIHDSAHGQNGDGYYFGGAGSDVFVQNVSTVGTVLTDALGSSKQGDYLSFDGNTTGTHSYTNNINTTHDNNFANTFTWDVMGDSSLHNAKYKGYISEIVIWTNLTQNYFDLWDSNVRSNLHYYATNTYGFAP